MAGQKSPVAVEAPEVEKQCTSDAMDEAAEYLAHNTGLSPLSLEEEKMMIRKMDWILLPMVPSILLSGENQMLTWPI